MDPLRDLASPWLTALCAFIRRAMARCPCKESPWGLIASNINGRTLREAIPKALAILEWTVEQSDDETHHAKVKTKSAFLSYSSVLTVDGVVVNEKMCRVTVQAETPVTTITSIADIGRSRERIQMFFAALSEQLATNDKT